MFIEAILKAKALLVRELALSLSRSMVYQQTIFISADVYCEIIDASFALVYWCTYFNVLNLNGFDLAGLSPGKILTLCKDWRVPVRMFDIIYPILAPVMIGKTMCIPGPACVTCVNRELSDTLYTFGSVMGPILPMASRYGICIRPGYVALLQATAGNFVTLQMQENFDILPSQRIIRFEPVVREEVHSNTLFNAEGQPIVESVVDRDHLVQWKLDVTREVDFSFEEKNEELGDAPEGPKPAEEIRERFEEHSKDLFDSEAVDYSDCNWFIPFPYTKYDEDSLTYMLSAWLHLVVYSDFDMSYGTPMVPPVRYGFCILDEPSQYLTVYGKSGVRVNWYQNFQSVRDLRARENWIQPKIYEWNEHFQNVIHKVATDWDHAAFPFITNASEFIIPPLILPTESPFYPHTVKWTRFVSKQLSVKTPAMKNREGVYVKKTADSAVRTDPPVEEPGPPGG